MTSKPENDAVLTWPDPNDPRVLVITLNRPDSRNAVNNAVAQGLADAVSQLDDDATLCAGVVVGAGSGFCSGMDLSAFLAGEFPAAGGRGFAGLVERPPSKPIVAAIEGFAVAGGFEIALACDLIVAASDAKVGLPEVKRSLVASGGGLLRLPQRIPYSLAAEIALLGSHVPVKRLYDVGLVNRIVEPGTALEVALGLAASIADNAPLAVVGSKHILTRAGDWGMERGWLQQRTTVEAVNGSEDAREGSASFAERRDPVWRGR